MFAPLFDFFIRRQVPTNKNGSQSVQDHEPVLRAGEGGRTLDIHVGKVKASTRKPLSDQSVTTDAKADYTPDYIPDAKNGNGPAAAPLQNTLADSLAMIARLPLTDAEKADAVRQLLNPRKDAPR